MSISPHASLRRRVTTCLDVLPVYLDKVVPLGSTLLVVEPQHVKHLVDHNPVVYAPWRLLLVVGKAGNCLKRVDALLALARLEGYIIHYTQLAASALMN
uniref:Uncharacterized protein n=1 Tax=Timema genevievae TaxID=629358 RepID=A0A7R9K6T0_TIMGE|nr:unnamed protein product [Timema genevievae]